MTDEERHLLAAALATWQRASGLAPTGQADPATIDALRAALAALAAA
jgi:hypothetical protein